MPRFNLIAALLAFALYAYAQQQGWDPFGDGGQTQATRGSTRSSYHK